MQRYLVMPPLLADYPVKRMRKGVVFRLWKIREGMQAEELGNKKLELWKHWPVFISIPYRNQGCFQWVVELYWE